MTERELRVYLDHLIPRENLRYRRSGERIEPSALSQPPYLPLKDLRSESRTRFLRKPDFQRATWAWTPEDCVALLESLTKQRVIPSIIMWTSPDNNFEYILDGGHRISVILAWLRNDWGEKEVERFDDEDADMIFRAAERVRQLLIERRVGDIVDYDNAERELQRLTDEDKAPKKEMDSVAFERSKFSLALRRGAIQLHILWAPGDYKTAEEAFIQINKQGKKLSDWETKLVEYRNSGFARTVMAIGNPAITQHYWPSRIADDDEKNQQLGSMITDIKANISQIDEFLFEPPYETPIRRLRQPLLVAPSEDKRFEYIAELLTIIQGHRGQPADVAKQLEAGKNALPESIVQTGLDLTQNATAALQHLIGKSNYSLGLVPALYFYTLSGRHVRRS